MGKLDLKSNRRLFLVLLSGGTLTSLNIATFLAGSRPYKVSWKCVSDSEIINPESVDSFWSSNIDKVSSKINPIFDSKKWVLREKHGVDSSDGSVIITKEFKSKLHFNFYVDLWDFLNLNSDSSNHLVSISYKRIANHLF